MPEIGGAKTGGSPPNPRMGAYSGNEGRGMGTYQRRPGTKPVSAPYELSESAFETETTTAQKARLYEESVGFPNLAADEFVREQAKMAVKSCLAESVNNRQYFRSRWLTWYRLWRGESLDEEYAYGRRRMHSPEPFKVVETLHPKIMRTLFGNERWFKLYSLLEQTDDNAKIQEALCRQQLRESRFVEKASRFIRDGLIYGTAIQKCYWQQKLGWRTHRVGKRVPNEEFTGTTKIELSEINQEELLFDGNTTENVSIFDYMISPQASSMADAEWCGDRSTWADFAIKEMGELGHWINLKPLRDHPGNRGASTDDEYKKRKSYTYGLNDPDNSAPSPHIPHYEVIDWWGPLVTQQKDGSYTTRICNVVMIDPDNLAIIARVTENPFWHGELPYQMWRPIEVEDEAYGVGVLEMIARLSREKDMKRNLLMAATQLEANPMLAVSDEANIPDAQLVVQPGKVFRVPGDPTRAIHAFHVPQVSDAALKAENVLTMDIRETSGATSPSMGAKDPFGSDKTATQHMAEIDESNLRLVPMIQNYETQVIDPMLTQMTWNNQQFQSYMRVVREIGALGMRFHDRYEIRPEDLVGRFLVQPLASHKLTTKQTQVQQLVNILDRAPIINQMYGPKAVNMPKLLAMILEQGFDIRNVDEFISAGDSNLLTPSQEHELWYHGNVPDVHPDDNNLRHIQGHTEEMASERLKELEKKSPGTVARAHAHLRKHLFEFERQQMLQEDQLMQGAQHGALMSAMQPGGGAGSPVAGAGGPGQDPGSPKVRRNENERGENGPQGEAMSRAPNPGAS